VSAVVVDVGTCNTKAGYAGEDSPKAVFPTYVGTIYSKGQDNTVGSAPKAVGEEGETEIKHANNNNNNNVQYYVGTSAIHFRRPLMEVENPLENGLVHRWDTMEQLWDHAFHTQLRLEPSEHPLLLGEPSFNTRQIRETSTELMFEKYRIPALFISKNAVLTSFSSGKATSIVLDSGGGVTSAVPVHDGYALRKAIISSTLAGNRITEELHKYLEKKGVNIKPSFMISRKEIRPGEFQVKLKETPNTTPSYMNYMVLNVVRDIKETIIRVSENPFDENANATIPTVPYELPDGNTVEIGTERFAVPELLFNPSSINISGGPNAEAGGVSTNNFTGVHQMIYDAVSKCDLDIRRELFNNVIVTGGNSLLPGFHERLANELPEVAPQQMPYKVKITSTPNSTERKFSVWIGGSILASLGTFQQMWVSKAEYEEHGRSIVERKCP